MTQIMLEMRSVPPTRLSKSTGWGMAQNTVEAFSVPRWRQACTSSSLRRWT